MLQANNQMLHLVFLFWPFLKIFNVSLGPHIVTLTSLCAEQILMLVKGHFMYCTFICLPGERVNMEPRPSFSNSGRLPHRNVVPEMPFLPAAGMGKSRKRMQSANNLEVTKRQVIDLGHSHVDTIIVKNVCIFLRVCCYRLMSCHNL